MKIFVNDNTNFKFSQQLVDHWISLGHEVEKELGANPEKAEKTDIVWVDFLDSNVQCYYHNNTNIKKLIVRAIDIDVWMDRHKEEGLIKYIVDHGELVVIAQHLYDKVLQESIGIKDHLHLIAPGISSKYFVPPAFQIQNMRAFNYTIGINCGDIWELKNVIEGFRIYQIVKRNSTDERWKLKIRGQHNEREMEKIMKDHILFSDPDVELIPYMEDIRNIYTQIDFLIVPSLKEAFSYACAEAMAMGVKPVLNRWYGNERIWPGKYQYKDLLDAAAMITYQDYDSEQYRKDCLHKYNEKIMFTKIDELLGL